MIDLLLRTRIRILFNLLKDSRKMRISVFIILALVLFGIIVVGFLSDILKMAASSPAIGGKLVENIAALTMHGIFLLMCFYGLSYAVYSVFFGKDLELLFSLPLGRKDIFLFKVIEAAFFNSRISIIFAMPALAVMGIYYNAGPHYYLFVLGLIMVLTAIPGSLGIIAASFIAKKVTRTRLRNALAVTGILVGLIVWGVFNIIGKSLGGDFSVSADVNGIIYANTSPVLSYFPSGWTSIAAISVAKGEWVSFIFYFGLTAACAVLLTFFAYRSIGWYFREGVVEEYSGSVESRFLSFGGGGSPLLAHLRRDIIIIFREINALSQSIILLIFLAIFPFFTGSAAGDEPFPLSIPPMSLIFSNILGCQMGSRFIPLERLGFWLNITAPSGARHAVLSKSIVGLMCGIFIALIVGIIHLTNGITTEINYILFLAGFFWGGFGAGMAFSIYFSDFRWENPNRMLRMGGLYLYLFSIVGIAAPLGLSAFIAGEIFPGIIDPGLLVVLLSIFLVLISILITRNKLSNFEWNVKV